MQMAQSTYPLQSSWFLQEDHLCASVRPAHSDPVICTPFMITSFPSTVLREGASQFLPDSLVLGASTPIALHKANYCLLCQDSTVHHPPKGCLRSLCHFSGRYSEWGKDLPLGSENSRDPLAYAATEILNSYNIHFSALL